MEQEEMFILSSHRTEDDTSGKKSNSPINIYKVIKIDCYIGSNTATYPV